MNSDGDKVATKIIDLDNLYKFVVNNVLKNHLGP
jgi:hypothetical protein